MYYVLKAINCWLNKLHLSFRDNSEMAIDLNILKLMTFLSPSSQGPLWVKSEHSPKCYLVRGNASRAPWWLMSGVLDVAGRNQKVWSRQSVGFHCFHCVRPGNKAFPSPVCCWKTQYWLILNPFPDLKNELLLNTKEQKRKQKAEEFMTIQFLSYFLFSLMAVMVA